MDFMNETHFKRFLMIIKGAGFVDSSLIRAQAPVNFAYALFLKLRTDKYPPAEIERFVRRWFVLSMLTGRYSSSMESRFDEDIRQIDEHGFGKYLADTEAANLSDTFWSVGLPQNLTTSNSNHPAFKTFLAAQAKAGTHGFLSRDITVRSMLEHRGDAQHLFPKNYLKKELKLTQARYNQVANYVYTQQEINIAIGDQRPEQYMGKVRDQCNGGAPQYGGIDDESTLRENLAENAIPLGFLDGALYDYDKFPDER